MVEMQHEFSIKEQELQIERMKLQRRDEEQFGRVLRPKLPKFDERQDEMDSYIERFERFARGQGWNVDTWATSLSSLLTGKGLEVYTSMPPGEANDYTALKVAVLKRYQLTEEGFRTKFRTSRPDAGETVFQYVARLRRYLTRWTEMATDEKNYESLFDLILREQFMQGCSSDVAMFLKERSPTTVADMTKMAEQYLEAHGGKITNSRTISNIHSRVAPLELHTGRSTQHQSEGTQRRNQHSNFDRNKTCFICNRPGHIARDCRRRQFSKNEKRIGAICAHSEVREGPIADNTVERRLKLENGDSLPILSGGCTIEMLEGTRNLDIKKGFVGTKEVKVLRDTGCELAAVRKELVRKEQFLDKQIIMVTIECDAKTVPTAKIEVNTPYYVGELEVMMPKTLICDLIIGNVPGVTDKPDRSWIEKHCQEAIVAVMTRSQIRKAEQPLKALNVPAPSVAKELNLVELKAEQRKDSSLEKLWKTSQEGQEKETKSGACYKYEERKGILYRVFKQKRGDEECETRQVVVPLPVRERVMELAHESIVGGHLSAKKTLDRISSSFYWPGIDGDVKRYCRSCDMCQRMIPKGRVSKVPLGTMPIIEEPFRRMAMDIIGPISPVSDGGNRYILTIVDYATRYPEAVALRSVDTERVAEAMLEVFSRVGFPSEILSDNGSQFTSRLMKEVSRLISLKQLFTTPYNPKCNGLCERINGVLKSMLKKMCQERPKDWDRYLPSVLFAYREVPQASTGFSPFQLLYGRAVRGPMQILEDLWTEEDTSEVHNTYQYVLDLKHRLEETCRIASESVKKAGETYKHHYDKRTRRRDLAVGDRVLVLLPTDRNKMILQWKGPFEVTERINKVDYKVNMGSRNSTYHINLLKKYEERNEIFASVAIVEAEEDTQIGAVDDENLLELPKIISKETYRDVKVWEGLKAEQKSQVWDLIRQFKDIFTEQPGTTNLAEHTIELTTQTPVRTGSYSMPYAKRDIIGREVEEMLKSGVIEKAISDYNSSIVMVKKKDGSNRFCVDFRKLNAVTKFDTEPMANVEDILAKLKDDKFFSKIDLAKGYWHIPVKAECRHLTAFSTDKGSFKFKKMPFGMVNSGATFNRMMRRLLDGCNNVDNYVGDIIGHTQGWEKHLETLGETFRRIREAKLTVRPTKCLIGFSNIGFTGYTVGNGLLQMEEDKVEKIKNAQVPKTKKQVRSFLGLASYYRKFIPMFAETAASLTDLTKKGRPNIVKWTTIEDKAFKTLKEQLIKEPILRLPDFLKQFVLQTDASDVGIGAALLQKYDDGLFSMAFASKKLLPRERNYSVTERECLAIIFGIRHFQKYLYGKEFVIQTDHSALIYIQRSKMENGRLMRWALFLQSYKFRIEAIKGPENRIADFLSRAYSRDNQEADRCDMDVADSKQITLAEECAKKKMVTSGQSVDLLTAVVEQNTETDI